MYTFLTRTSCLTRGFTSLVHFKATLNKSYPLVTQTTRSVKKETHKYKRRKRLELEKQTREQQFQRERMQWLQRKQKEEEKKKLRELAISKGQVISEKIKAPRPPKKDVLPIPEVVTDAKPDNFREFFETYHNVNYENDGNGFCDIKALASTASFTKYRENVISQIQDLISKVSKAEGTQILSLLDEIEMNIFQLKTYCQLVKNFHPWQAMVEVAQTNEELLEAFLFQNYNNRTELFNKLESLKNDSSLTDDQKNLLQTLLTRYSRLGMNFGPEKAKEFTSLLIDSEKRYEAFANYIPTLPPVKIKDPSRFYELPRDVYFDIPRSLERRRRLSLVSLDKHLLPILTHVSVEALRKDFYDKARDFVENKNSEFINNAKRYISAKTEVAKFRGFESVGDMERKERSVLSLTDVLELTTKLAESLEFDEFIKELQSAKDATKHHAIPSGPVQAHDLWYFEKASIVQKQTYEPDAIRQFFPISRCVEGLDMLSQELFNLKLQPEKLGKNETWSPKEIKKLAVIDMKTQQTVGYLYLDVIRRDGRKPEKSGCFTIHHAFQQDLPSCIIYCKFEKENMLGLPCLLSHEELRDLLTQFGKAMLVLISKNQYHTLLEDEGMRVMQNIFGHLFEKFSRSSDFLESFARHYHTNTPIFKEYVQQLITLEKPSKLAAITEIINSAIDTEWFGKQPLKYSHQEIVTGFEARLTSGFPVTVDLASFKSFGGVYHLNLLAQLFASQIWATVFQYGKQLKDGGQKLKKSCKGQPLLASMRELIGSEKPDVKYYIEEIKH